MAMIAMGLFVKEKMSSHENLFIYLAWRVYRLSQVKFLKVRFDMFKEQIKKKKMPIFYNSGAYMLSN